MVKFCCKDVLLEDFDLFIGKFWIGCIVILLGLVDFVGDLCGVFRSCYGEGV